MTDISNFFTALSERAYKENDLSDVTYAMCEADKRFKECFLQFFFGENFEVDSVKKFQREHSVDDSRPDFWIETSNGLYLVEVKINDGSHHFQKYLSILERKNSNLSREDNKKRLGYIAAYKIIADEEGKPICDFPVKTWGEFKKQLKGLLKGLPGEDPFMNGYVEYLEAVTVGTMADEGWVFEIKDFNQIGAFDFALHGELLNLVQAGIGKEYKTATSYNPLCRKGFYLDAVQVGGRSQCPFIGVYFGDKKNQQLCVGFERAEKWGDVVCAEYENNERLKRFAVNESEGVFFYPDQTKPTAGTYSDYIKAVVDICNRGQNQEVPTIQGPLPPYRSIRNLVLKLRELFLKNNLAYYSHSDSRKNRYLHYGEWCTLETNKAGRTDGLLFMWFGVRYTSKDGAKLVCEIRTEGGWNERYRGNDGWLGIKDEADWNLITKSAEENTTLEAFIEEIIKEVQK